jgi:hypothetical protein
MCNDVPSANRPPTEPEGRAQALITVEDGPQTGRRRIGAIVRAHGEAAIVAALGEVATRRSGSASQDPVDG